MQDEKIKEAIEVVRKDRHKVTWNAESSKEYNKALDALLNLASKFLEVSGRMPEEMPIPTEPEPSKDISYAKGYNQARWRMAFWRKRSD